MSFIRANTSYKVKLADFEGPLDLLLHLIRESKLDIKTVPLAQMTGQYLAFFSQLDGIDLNLASEFIEVGSTLIEIKSRQILPRDVENTEEESAEDLENRLRAQLEEYKLLKDASEQLKLHENLNRFYKDPEPIKEVIKYTLDGLDMDNLAAAFAKVMHRIIKTAEPIKQKEIRLDRFTVAEKITDIRSRLGNGLRAGLPFTQLFDDDATRSEVINTFLALLELLKTGEAKITQSEQFSEITIIKGDNYGTNTAIETEYEPATEPQADLQYTIIDGIND